MRTNQSNGASIGYGFGCFFVVPVMDASGQLQVINHYMVYWNTSICTTRCDYIMPLRLGNVLQINIC